MYSTCLFCHAALGTNESFEQFPVGRRLAYDASKGRLWVVCTKCARWNLTPLEQRWETIEDAERVYRETKKRVTTENVGLARLRDGTDLIRIGAPLRPEFAAWRYGDQFGRRYRNRLMLGGSAAVIGVGAATAISMGSGTLMGAASLGYTIFSLGYSARFFATRFFPSRRFNRVTVTANDGLRIGLTRADIRLAVVSVGVPEAEGAWSEPSLYFMRSGTERKSPIKHFTNADGVTVAYSDTGEHVHGSAALQSMAQVLAVLNNLSGAPRHVAEAVALAEDSTSPSALIAATGPQAKFPFWYRSKHEFSTAFPLAFLPAPARLALEMSLHEHSERRAMHGELHELENRWKEAEQIAGIADSLTLSNAVNDRFASLRDTADHTGKESRTERE